MHHGIRKAVRCTESDVTGRRAAHHAGPGGTPERHAGAKQQRPPAATNPESAHNTQRATADRCQATPAAVRMDECAPGGYPAPAGYEQPPSCWTSARPAAHSAPAGYETGAIRMDKCAPRGYPAPAGYEHPPSGWTSVRPAATPRARNPQNNTPSEHTGEQEPSGPGNRTPNTAHRASTPVIKSKAAQYTVHATQHSERAHR